MKFWLDTLCILYLNVVLIIATKKEDLERAAELAVERAAERVAERAVEKALEAGNSTTTTVTVKEGYSNARKVAEEQAAPGSESTRHLAGHSDFLPPDEYRYLGGRQLARSDGNIEIDEQPERVSSKEEANVDYREEEDYPVDDGKNNGEMSKTSEFEDYQQETAKRSKQKEEGEDADDSDLDLSHENKAWKDYSNWENNFKSARKENWTGKAAWGGDDAFFWDMDDSETRHNSQHKTKRIPVTKLRTERNSRQSRKKERSVPDEDSFSWSKRPFHMESNTENEKPREKLSILDFFTTERSKFENEEGKRRNKKVVKKVSWKNKDFDDSESTEGQTSESEKHNVWLNTNSDKSDRTSREEADFDSWETKEMDSEEIDSKENEKELRDSGSWESIEASESRSTTTMVSPPRSNDIIRAEVKNFDFTPPKLKATSIDDEVINSRESDEFKFINTSKSENIDTDYFTRNLTNLNIETDDTQQDRILSTVQDETTTNPVKLQKSNFRFKKPKVPLAYYLDEQFNNPRTKTRKEPLKTSSTRRRKPSFVRPHVLSQQLKANVYNSYAHPYSYHERKKKYVTFKRPKIDAPVSHHYDPNFYPQNMYNMQYI